MPNDRAISISDAEALVASANGSGDPDAIGRANHELASLDPSAFDAALAASQWLLGRGDVEKALGVLTFCTDSNPRLHQRRGQLLLRLERPSEALEQFAAALALRPSHVPSLFGKAEAMSATSGGRAAAEFLRSCRPMLENDPAYPSLLKRYELGDDALIQFVHIPKTGGAAMNQLLRSIYRSGYYRHGPPSRDVAQVADPKRLTVLSSHARRGYEAQECFAGRVVLPFTVVRDPIQRAVSQYNYVTQTEKHPFHEWSLSVTLAEFFSHPWIGRTNEQATMIVGSDDDIDAVDVLKATFLAVATTKNHAQLTAVLADQLGWPPGLRVAQQFNRSEHTLTVESLPSELKSQLENSNTRDRALYDYVKGLESPLLNTTSTLRARQTNR